MENKQILEILGSSVSSVEFSKTGDKVNYKVKSYNNDTAKAWNATKSVVETIESFIAANAEVKVNGTFKLSDTKTKKLSKS